MAALAVSGQQACEPLAACLCDDRCQVRLGVIEALSALQRLQGPGEFLLGPTVEVNAGAFERPLQHEDPEVRAVAQDAVVVPYYPNPVAAYDHIVELSDPNRSTRRHAASELERLRYPEALSSLIEALDDDDTWVRLWSASAVGEISSHGHNQKAVDALVSALAREQDPNVRTVLVRGLWWMYPESLAAVPTLIRVLREDPAPVRRAAVGALGRMRSETTESETALEKAVKPLISRLDDPDRLVRGETYAALAQFGASAGRAVPRLLELLGEGSAQVIFSAREPDEVAPMLLPLLESEYALTRSAAAHSLWRCADDDRVVAALILTLRDSDAGVRKASARALGNARSHSADVVPRLMDAMADPESSVRAAAMSSLST